MNVSKLIKKLKDVNSNSNVVINIENGNDVSICDDIELYIDDCYNEVVISGKLYKGNKMKVSELIEKLKDVNGDSDVNINIEIGDNVISSYDIEFYNDDFYNNVVLSGVESDYE